jgi:YHS domain-containing protein
LINRIDHEVAVVVGSEKAARVEIVRANRERETRLRHYEAAAQHVIELLKPRLDAFIDRFQPLIQAEPTVREHTHGVTLTFAATVAKATLTFEASPDRDVNNICLECTQEIVPVLVRCDRPSLFVFPPDAIQDDAVVQWFDDRIVAFVKFYLALVRQDGELRERLKDRLVEDPVAHILFPKHIAASSLERDGRTYYFVDDDTRREFEKQPAAK